MAVTRAESMTDWVQGQMKREMCAFFWEDDVIARKMLFFCLK
jgi:hypothetical protein